MSRRGAPEGIGGGAAVRSAPRTRGEPESAPLGREPPLRILFVCTGNTCRSPLAEWIARHEAERRGRRDIEVRSAGTHALDGDAAARLAEVVAAERGVPVPPHRSTALTRHGVWWADLVVGMSPEHLAAAAALEPSRPLALATDYLPFDHPEYGRSVPDPIGGGRPLYEKTFDVLEECVKGLLDRLAPGGTRGPWR